jgi:serine protease AprX
MPEINPIILLPYAQNEFSRKPGGGRTPSPLVDVNSDLRAGLAAQLNELAELAISSRASASDPLPVKVKLREKALAKSNRPYKLLGAAALPAVAGAGPGELIVEGTADRLRNLASTIQLSESKPDVYSISTFLSFSPWNFERDVFGLDSAEDVEGVLKSAREQGRFVKVTFFPWISKVVRRTAGPQGAITGGSSGSQSSALLSAYSSVLGTEVHTANFSPARPVVYLDPTSNVSSSELARVKGIRSVSIAPEYSPIEVSPQSYAEVRPLESGDFVAPGIDAPVVGLLDSGVNSRYLEHGVVGRETFNVPADSDTWHGTFVSGLIMDSNTLNDGDHNFPTDSARVFDAEVLPSKSIPEPLLYQRITDSVQRASDVKIWNCSFGADPWGEPEYGSFAQDLDALSDERGLLFVQAAGNYGPPGRSWPPVVAAGHLDGLSSPAEAIRSLTVGARAHKGGFVPEGAPSSYSRRGPNFALHVKPDVSHWAGDVNDLGVLGGFGVQSIVPGDLIGESVGTSFSTPIVSSIAANVWQQLEQSQSTPPTPELVKGLIVHAATLASHDLDPKHRQYFGWGTPPSSEQILANDEFTFTTVNEVVLTPGLDWYKRPFPVPQPLITSEGKFRGEILLTLSYAPPLNAAFGAETVRYDVSGAFGSFDTGPDGMEHFNSITPQEQVVGANWESSQVADGKWSPLKSHRAKYSQGKKGGEWALRLSLTERVSDEIQREQRVYAIVTFRAIVPDVSIYESGVSEVNRIGHVNRTMLSSTRIRVHGS